MWRRTRPVAREAILGEFKELRAGKPQRSLVTVPNKEFQAANATLCLPCLGDAAAPD